MRSQPAISCLTGLGRLRGFTLLEVVISLGIMAVVGTSMAAIVPLILTQSAKESGKLAIEGRHQGARYWVTRDANSAETYTPGTSPTYGTFTWRDFSGEVTDTHDVIYSYNSTVKAVMREEKVNGVSQTTAQVAGDILQAGDVVFSWSAGERKITVNLTPKIEESHAVGDVSRAGTLVAFLRYEAEPLVAPPSDVAVPTPIPGSVTYYASSNPTVAAGTYASGNSVSLQTSDTNYYVVNSSSGNPKLVVWTASSQSINSPSPTNQVEVRIVAKADRSNVSVNLYVKIGANSTYSAAPDSGFTFTQADTETTHLFYLSTEQLASLNLASPKDVYIKVEASGSASFTLSANQLLFIASP